MHAVYCKFTLYFDYESWLLSENSAATWVENFGGDLTYLFIYYFYFILCLSFLPHVLGDYVINVQCTISIITIVIPIHINCKSNFLLTWVNGDKSNVWGVGREMGIAWWVRGGWGKKFCQWGKGEGNKIAMRDGNGNNYVPAEVSIGELSWPM